MRIKAGYKIRELGDTYIVVIDKPGGRTDMSSILSFNESAAWLWKQACGRDWDEHWLTEQLCGEYDIEPGYAAEEVARIVAEWRRYGFVEEA